MRSCFRFKTLLLLAVLAGCGGGGDGEGDEFGDFAASAVDDARAELEAPTAISARAAAAPLETGDLRIALASASSCGLKHLWLSVRAIRIYRTEAAANTDTGAYELTLLPPRRIDLVSLKGGLLADLGTTALPVGQYEALRLVLSSNGPDGAPDAALNAVQTSGAPPKPFTTAAAGPPGIKASYYFNVMTGQTRDVLLGVHACTSPVKPGKAGQYVLKPMVSVQPRSPSPAVPSPSPKIGNASGNTRAT